MARYKHLLLTPVLALVGVAPAHAAWSTPERVSPSHTDVLVHQLGGDADGPARLAFFAGRDRFSTATATPARGRLRTSRSRRFTHVVWDSAGRGIAARIVERRRGRAGYGVVEVGRLTASGRIVAVKSLTKIPTSASGLALAANGTGDVLAAWTTRRGPGTTGRIQIAQGTTARGLRVSGGVSGKGAASRAAAAINDRGDAVVAFVEDGRARAAFTSNEGVFASAQDLGPANQNSAVLSTAVGPQGHAVVAWSEFAVTGDTYEGPPVTTVRAATKLPLKDFAPAAQVLDTAATLTRFGPNTAVAPDGTALVGWAHDNGPYGGASARVASAAPGGPPFGTPRDLSAAAGADAPVVAFAADGTAFAAWIRQNQVLEAATRAPGGDWTAASEIARSFVIGDLRIAPARPGRAALTFLTRSGDRGRHVLRLSRYEP